MFNTSSLIPFDVDIMAHGGVSSNHALIFNASVTATSELNCFVISSFETAKTERYISDTNNFGPSCLYYLIPIAIALQQYLTVLVNF